MKTKLLIGLIILTIAGCKKEETVETCYDCTTRVIYTDNSNGYQYRMPNEESEVCGVTNSGENTETGTFQFEHPIVQDSIMTITGSKLTVKRCQ